MAIDDLREDDDNGMMDIPSSEEGVRRAVQEAMDRMQKDEERVLETKKLEDRHLEAIKMGARIAFRTAFAIETSIAGPERAFDIYQRNRRWYRAPEIAAAILQACEGNAALLNAIRADVNDNGGLIEERTPRDFATWLIDPQRHIFAEASALHPDPQSPHHMERVLAADCHCILPADRKDARRVIPYMLDPKKKPRPDLVYDRDLFEQLRQANPATIGYIDQICVEHDFAHLRVAAAARHRALTYIISHLSRKYPIDHMIGLAFCIQGIALDDGKRFLLHEYDQKSITNMISLIVNEHSKRCPATIVGRVRDQKVPVAFMYGDIPMSGGLLTDWYFLDHETAHIQL